MKKKMCFYSVIISILVIISAVYIYAASDDDPVPLENLNATRNERMNMSQFSASHHEAEAGNVTRMELWSHSQTKHWQGYYGEITGVITLDDGQNWTMYDWYNDEPKGEIYALCNTSGVTPTWSTVECFNYSQPSDVYSGNLGRWERYYNMTWNDVDGINETFNMTTHETFAVGTYTINASSCPSTWTYVNDHYQTTYFSEVLLQTDDYQLIYVTIIENDDEANNTAVTGFDSETHDFQMIVGEDGTSYKDDDRNDDSTTYYFYVDLE